MTDLEKQFVELLTVAQAMQEYIDAIPKDIILPAMPGYDRDWSDGVLYDAEKLCEKFPD